ncbi:MAG TPA: homoserine dehydrogenase [Gemmatimonadaceae bacterium]|nr:homoserine dehydrogenase [Gemmatimonadaceae bacterium]
MTPAVEPLLSPLFDEDLASVRIGLLGLGNVGSAFARLACAERERLRRLGISPVLTTALVRSTTRSRTAADLVECVTSDPDRFFAQPLDVVVEVLGGIDAPSTFVRRALDRAIPVVTANKSLIAADGHALGELARRRRTPLRYEASCIAGVPFLGTFERRPLASRVRGVTAILNGTSNRIVAGLERGASFDAALLDAQRLGLAEPDASADVSGRDAAEKLALLIRQFGHLVVVPGDIDTRGIDAIGPLDLRAARALGGTLKPLACAKWSGTSVGAFVGPAFVSAAHPLARIDGATNGIVLDAIGGAQCFVGPGAGPDVTAATLLDDVVEIVSERNARVRPPTPVREALPNPPSDAAWLLRIAGEPPHPETTELLGTFGAWYSRVSRLEGRVYALTFPAPASRIDAACLALRAATGYEVDAFPAIDVETLAC